MIGPTGTGCPPVRTPRAATMDGALWHPPHRGRLRVRSLRKVSAPFSGQPSLPSTAP